MNALNRALLSKRGDLGDWDAPFPLTPALSLGERGTLAPVLALSNGASFAEDRPAILPHPKGEVRGERKETAGNPTSFARFERSSAFHPFNRYTASPLHRFTALAAAPPL
jgi:hypothetical protein